MATISKISALFAAFSFGFWAFVAEIYADTHTAASASYAAVSAAVSNASRGDTVVVPAGTATWSSTLTITKGLRLIGAGRDNTVITGRSTLINIAPDSTALFNEETIQVGGFTFDGSNSAITLMTVDGAGPSSSKAFKKLVVGNNRFRNMLNITSGAGAVTTSGQVRGVIYSNIFDRCDVIFKIMGNDDITEWKNGHFPFSYGSEDNLYVENNTILYSTSYSGMDPGWTETGQGGRWVFRYNTYDATNVTGLGELWDVHGFQNWPGNGQTGTMVTEYYGNTLTNIPASIYRWQNLRGSWMMMFNNIATGSGSASMSISINQYDVGDNGGSGCDEQSGMLGYGTGEVNNSYVFNNTYNSKIQNIGPASPIGNGCGTAENVSYWNYNAACTASSCTSGIGRGTTAPTGTCTSGVGFWKASTSTPTVGSSVIQNGTFYKCIATNTWRAYYTPYTYPHPLRGVPAPNNLKIISQ